jgi:hypothetical protein
LISWERFSVELNERNKRATKIRQIASATIDQCGDCRDHAAVLANDIDGFCTRPPRVTTSSATMKRSAGAILNPPTQDELTFFLFGEDMGFSRLRAYFVANDDSTEGRGDHGSGVDPAQLIRESAADSGRNRRVLQQQGALEKLAAVQAAAQEEMTVEEGVRAAEKVEDLVGCHGMK